MLIDMLVRVFGADLPILALLFVGILVEKYYVSRVTVFTNVIALNISFLSIDQAPRSLVWYGDLGLILGAYGLLCYLLNVKTWWGYNGPAFLLYASLPVAVVILAAPGDWWIALLIGGAMNLIVGWVLEDGLDIPIMHWGPQPGPVSRFIETGTMEFVGPYGVHRHVDLSQGKFNRR